MTTRGPGRSAAASIFIACSDSASASAAEFVGKPAHREHSGGPGKFRGGLGIDMTVKNFVEGRWNLALEAKALKVRKAFDELVDEVLKLDPAHAAANESRGNVLYDGKWLKPADRDRRQRGDVHRLGSWHSLHLDRLHRQP